MNMLDRVATSSLEEPGMTSRWVAHDGGTAGLALALRRNDACVAIVTAQGADGSLVGACCPEPPALSAAGSMVLGWTLSDAESGLQVFSHATHVAIHFVAVHDKAGSELAHHFAVPGCDKFAALAFEFGLGGAPLLERAVATFECENRLQTPADGQGRRHFSGPVRRYRQAT